MDITTPLTQEQVVERLLLAASGRRDLARSVPSARDGLEAEAGIYDDAAAIAAGDLAPLARAVPPRSRTPQMQAAVDAGQALQTAATRHSEQS